MPKGKFVSSMISFFAKKSKEGSDDNHLSVKRAKPTRSGRGGRSRKSMLDADSFVFLPGEKVDLYWGAVLNDQNYPISDLAADYSTARAVFTRRQTVGSSHLTRSEESSSGVQNVQVLRPRANTNAITASSSLKNGSVFSRRLSGTLVKGKKPTGTGTDEVEDGSLLVDYGLCLSDRERWSQDLSGKYVYDRIYSPKHTSTPDNDQRVTQSHQHETPHRHSFLHSPPAEQAAPPAKRRSSKPVKKGDSRKNTVSEVSHSYFDLEPEVLNSEYDLPWDSVDWERIKRRAFQLEGSEPVMLLFYPMVVCKAIPV